MLRILSLIFAFASALAACTGTSNSDSTANTASSSRRDTIRFNADTAYAYVRDQVAFGPRIPGTDSHRRCAEWIVGTLADHGVDTIITQNALLSAFNGDQLPSTNIMAMINPEATSRVLLAGHYDTRPWADNSQRKEDHGTPVLGANDGGSGVAVLLEIARALKDKRPEIGVDLLFVDAEDYGTNEGWGLNEETWCLGTQYWAENNPYTDANRPRYGIVLDMVGGTGARFHREYFSNANAHGVVDKVWGQAARDGLSHIFINEVGGSLVDDHIFINRAGIPCIDIVECNNPHTGSFPPTWHTTHDDMAAIDATSLRAVGQTVLNVIVNERP